MKKLLSEAIKDQKISNDKFQYNQLLRKVVSQELLFEKLDKRIGQVLRNKVEIKPYKRLDCKSSYKRILNLLLSDLHFGADLNPKEVPNQYGVVEEARRIAAITKQCVDYKRQHREDTTLYVHLAGDIIQGTLHDQRDGDILAQQAARAMYLLSQVVGQLSANFPSVVVRCTTGNHGRRVDRHKERATLQKVDSNETMIYAAIKLATAHLSNVKVLIPYTPYFTFQAFDKLGFVTHGDTVLMPGNTGKSINIESIRKQTNEINSKLEAKNQFSLFAVGHVHTGTMSFLPNGSVFLSNGALIPTDAYGLSIGLFSVTNGQWLWESVPGHIMGDARFLQVDESIDKDVSLDKIIKPFSSL